MSQEPQKQVPPTVVPISGQTARLFPTRRIVMAHLQESCRIPGAPEHQDTFDSRQKPERGREPFSFEWLTVGLEIKRGPDSVFVPWTNIRYVVLAKDEA